MPVHIRRSVFFCPAIKNLKGPRVYKIVFFSAKVRFLRHVNLLCRRKNMLLSGKMSGPLEIYPDLLR